MLAGETQRLEKKVGEIGREKSEMLLRLEQVRWGPPLALGGGGGVVVVVSVYLPSERLTGIFFKGFA